jgi:hypothetical protein
MMTESIREVNLAKGAERLRWQNKKDEIRQMEERLRQEKLRVDRLKPANDPNKGNNVDVSV